jgi:hypothetical protein
MPSSLVTFPNGLMKQLMNWQRWHLAEIQSRPASLLAISTSLRSISKSQGRLAMSRPL